MFKDCNNIGTKKGLYCFIAMLTVTWGVFTAVLFLTNI